MNCLKNLENISEIWVYESLEKRRLHKTLFSEGIFFDAENYQYLTRKINSYVELVNRLSMSCEGKKIGLSNNNIEKSYSVAGSGVEPETFGL